MSSGYSYAELIVLLENEIASDLLYYSALVLLLWDTLCTFDDEIVIVWDEKFSLGVWFYIFTRYGTLLSVFLELFEPPLDHTKACVVWETFASWTEIFVTIGFHGLLTLRTYAISGGNIYILITLLTIDIGRFVNQLISFATVISFCYHPSQELIDQNSKELIANLVFNLTAECIACAIAVYATYGNWSFFRRNKQEGKNLSVMVFEQGVVTFGIILSIPILTKILVKVFPERASVIESAQPFSLALPTLVTCRFFLSLRQRNLNRMSYRDGNSRMSSYRDGNSPIRFGTVTTLTTSRSGARSRSMSVPMSASTSVSARISSFPSLSFQQHIEREFGDVDTFALQIPEQESPQRLWTKEMEGIPV